MSTMDDVNAAPVLWPTPRNAPRYATGGYSGEDYLAQLCETNRVRLSAQFSKVPGLDGIIAANEGHAVGFIEPATFAWQAEGRMQPPGAVTPEWPRH